MLPGGCDAREWDIEGRLKTCLRLKTRVCERADGVEEIVQERPGDRPRRGRLRWLVLPALLILIGFIVWRELPQGPHTRATAAQVVSVAQATRGDMPVVLNELGTVTPTATVTVMPNQAVSGYLTEVPFKEGQDVEKGQLLAQIDPRPYQAALDQAIGTLQRDEGSLDEAKTDLALSETRHPGLYRAATGPRPSLRRRSGRGHRQARRGGARDGEAEPSLFPHHRAGRGARGPASGRSGQLRHRAQSTPASSVITTMKPTTVEFTVAAERSRPGGAARFQHGGAKRCR